MNTIKFKSVLKIIGLILLISAFSFLLCIPVALIYSEQVSPFILSFVIALVPGALLYFLPASHLNQKVTTREGYLSVTLGWVALVLSGALPYLLSGEMDSVVNAIFESVS